MRVPHDDHDYEIDLDYINDRYLVFALPFVLRRLVGQSCTSWFSAGNSKADRITETRESPCLPKLISVLKERLDATLRQLPAFLECWASTSSERTKLRSHTFLLQEAIHSYYDAFKTAWFDTRHRCYMEIANHDEFAREHDPGNLQYWDCLGFYSLEQEITRTKRGCQIAILNRRKEEIGQIRIGKNTLSSVASKIRERGWLNSARARLSQVVTEWSLLLNKPHQQLFELGCLIADVDWGKTWFKPTVLPTSLKALTIRLPKRLEELTIPLHLFVPADMFDAMKRLKRQSNCWNAREEAAAIGRQWHKTLHREKDGKSKIENERVLLASDLTKLPHLSWPDRRNIFNRVATCFQEVIKAPFRTATDNDEIVQLALLNQSAEERLTVQQSKTGQTERLPKDLKPAIWDRMKIICEAGAHRLLIAGEGSYPLTHYQVELMRFLISRKGNPIRAEMISIHLKKTFRFNRQGLKLPPEVRKYVVSAQGSGTFLSSTPTNHEP